ncbi:MAG: ATP-binding cassette domain-containing protein [Candidatus Micrarchaeota archaeon]
MPDPVFVIECYNLTRRFGDFTAVDAIELHVKKGELFGFLGPNGAGKSTTTYMLTTLLPPSGGTAKVNGFDIVRESAQVRKSIGIVFQDQTLDARLSAFDNLDIHGRMYGMPVQERKKRIDEVLELVELADWKHKMVKTFSGGMRRRLEIGRGLLHLPKILFLDEPTLGLDVQTRRHMWSYIQKLKSRGITIVLSTHYLEEADMLCDRIAIIDHGKIVALDTPKNLKNSIGGQVLGIKTSDSKKLLDLVVEKKLGKNPKLLDSLVVFEVLDGAKIIPKIISLAQKEGIVVESVELHGASLEDVFVKLTGEQIRKESAAPFGMAQGMRKRGF